MPRAISSGRTLATGRGLATGRALATARAMAVPNYTLYDAFTTARAAGGVNGTPSESPHVTGGGVLRTVGDTNSKLSIASEVVNFATGGGGGGDPRLFYPLQTRASGLTLLATLITPSITTNSLGGPAWQDSQGAAVMNIGLRFDSSGVLTARQQATSFAVGTWDVSTTYSVAVILRASGAWYFIKGGAFTNWTLLYLGTALSANQYPGILTSGTTAVFVIDNVRIPTTPIVPTPLVYDTFTRANGALGSTETTGPDERGISAGAWTLQNGTIAISANKAAVSAVSGGNAIATITASSPNVAILATPTRTSGNSGIILRYVDASNYVIAYFDGTNAKLDKVVAGVTTSVISGAVSGTVIMVICDGTSFRLYYNTNLVGTGTISDAALQTSGVCGLYGTSTNCTMDTFAVWARGSSNEYSALDAY